MKLSSCLLCLFMLFYCPFKICAQHINNKTLLWRISGNGLSRPSYLYGTMHLYDRRLFQFGDSVYRSLENTEAYAMELDPNSMMDSILIKLNEEDTTSLLEQMIDKKQYDTIAGKLEKKLGIPANRITRKILIAEREKQIYKRRNKEDMNAEVDLYLYDIARKKGKWVGGIEDVNDQSGIIDEMGKNFDVNEFLATDDEKIKENMNSIIDLYVTGDLDKIEAWVNSGQNAETKSLLLTRRNIKMARRMDSLSKLRSTFFAVGAAHLPGDDGVISLLRRNGFTVEPVFSSKKIAPQDYKFTAKEFDWMKIEGPDNLYTVEMPGKPTDINKFGNELKMKMYGDLASGSFFMTGYVGIDNGTNKDDAINKIMENFSAEKINKKEKKNIINNGINGVEINALRENVYCRLQIFITGNKEYMAIVGSPNHDNLFTKDANRFLQSFVMYANIEVKNNDWVTELDSAKAFSISFPKSPEIYILPPAKIKKNWTSTIYSAMDIKTNTYYILAINETKKGYLMYADSIYFNQHYEALINDTNNTHIEKKKVNYNGLPAMDIVSYSKSGVQELVTDFLMINKGNRNYTLVTVTEKNRMDSPNIKQFKNSFKILPWKISEWKNRASASNTFSTWAPSSIDLDVADTAGLAGYQLTKALETDKKRKQYLAYDTYSSTSYNIMLYPVSPYYWTNSDSSFYNDETERYYTDTSSYRTFKDPDNIDSLIYSRGIKNGNSMGREILVRNAGTASYKRIRVLRSGDSVYHLISFILKSDLDDTNNKKFFSDFTINGTIAPGHLFENKTARILADLSGNDSATFTDAMSALEAAKFTQTDLSLLLPALLKKYPFDTTRYAGTNRAIANVILPLMKDSAINFIRDEYPGIARSNGPIQQTLLELLAKHKTQNSYNILRDLYIENSPHENNYSFSYFLKDSLKLCATLFPAIERLYADSISAPLVIDLSVELSDSSLISKKSIQSHSAKIYEIAGAQLTGYSERP